MREFKVGDKVFMKQGINGCDYDIEQEVGVINKIDHGQTYDIHIIGDDGYTSWENSKVFTLNPNIKTGMIAIFKDDFAGTVLLDTEHGDVVVNITDGITRDFELNKIKQIYSNPEKNDLAGKWFNAYSSRLVYENKEYEIPEYTMEELVSKLGHDFKIKSDE